MVSAKFSMPVGILEKVLVSVPKQAMKTFMVVLSPDGASPTAGARTST